VATLETPQQAARAALLGICPAEMREQFTPLIELGLSTLSEEQCAKLANDIESTKDEGGTFDLSRLLEVGRGYGVTPEMVEQYQGAKGSSATDTQ
jgi:hypothetical protein